MEKFDTIPTDIYVSLGSEEAAKGNYDIALQYLEEAILRGDIAAIDTMLVVYQEMLISFPIRILLSIGITV